MLAAVLASSSSLATPALPAEALPATLYVDAEYQPAAPAAAMYEQRTPLRHDAARQAWHWQLYFAQPPGKLHMDAWLLSADVASPRYAYQRSVYFADGRLALLEERNGEGDFDGVNVEYHANGAVKSRKAYRDGEYEGLHSHYHANGQLSREMRYQAGQPADGEYLSFDEQGQISNRAHFADGVLSGEAQAFHPNGRLAERGPYLEGQRNGLHQTWWPDGREKSRLNFLHGKPQGWSLLYFANGQLDQKNLFEDGVMLSTQSWRDDGTPLHAVEYVDGRKHGLERRWGEDGTRTVCAWQDGRLLRPCSHF